ncbi:MAG TPA: MFS transporter, partial [Candidatus Bathyarchaeia archaeon]|nr:MFS transporter [Candidatus Bathyarchaeia archaeon]
MPRDLQLLFWSLFLWSFGFGLYNFVWPLFLQDLNANPGQVGLVFAVGFVAIGATMIPGGILANKYDLRLLLIIGWAMSIPPPLMFYFAKSWIDVIPGIVLFQASGFNVPAFNAYIAGATVAKRTGSSFGYVWASAPLGGAISPAVGGVLLSWISIRQIFILSFAFFTVSTLILFFMREQPARQEDVHRYKLEFPRSGPEAILLLFLTGSAVAVSLASPFLPLLFHDAMRLTPSTVQELGAIQALGLTLFAVLLGRRADIGRRGMTMALGVSAAAFGLGGIVFTRSLFFAFPLVFLFGSARASSYVAYSVLATIRPGATRGGQYGFYLTFESLGFVVGSYLGGILYYDSLTGGF